MRASHAQEVLDATGTFPSLPEALTGADISVGTTAQRTSTVYKTLRKPVTLRELAAAIAGLNGKVALVFGREGTGLNNKELALCDLALTISASPRYPTLNISHAAAIIFHELYTSRSSSPREVLAPTEVKQRILGFVENASDSIDLPRRNRALVSRAFKTLMGRSSMRAREASLLAGFFRKISAQLDREQQADHDKTSAS